jgi:predicted peptidase
MGRVLVLVLALLGTPPAFAETGFLDRTVTVNGTAYRYQVYVPLDYTPGKQWPVIVDLHGNGAQGSDGIRQTAHFLPEEIRLHRARFPLVVIFPQAAAGTTWQTATMQDMVSAEIEAALLEFHGDPDRVSLTGFSMGAFGVYAMAARWPTRFAALVAIAGDIPQSASDTAAQLRGTPIWLFHGETDERIPVTQSRQLFAALKQTGASVRYTEYPDTHHGPAVEKAYADPAVVDWLLTQRRINTSAR